MKRILKSWAVLVIAVLAMAVTSCVSKEKIIYVQDVEETLTETETNYQNIIQRDDVLRITVSSSNMEAVVPFNPMIGMATNQGMMANGQGRLFDYLVDSNGEITFPIVGQIMLAGLTRTQAQEKVQDVLKAYVKDAVVDIRVTNFKFTVLGEVGRPGTFNVVDNRVTLIQALGLAGDLTIYGKRESILIIRDVNGVQSSQRVDITSADFIYSEFYYLRQNDTIIVEPNGAQVQAAGFNRNASLWVSIASLLLSTIVVLSNINR